MKADIFKIKQCLKACELKEIFRDQLGWDNLLDASVHVKFEEQEYTFTSLAQKRGFKVYQHIFSGPIPREDILKQLDSRLNDFAVAHLTIFVDAKRKNQAWLWVKPKSEGKGKESHSATRLYRYNIKQNGEALAQKLNRLYISLGEEENLSLTTVLDRVMQAFDVEKIAKSFFDQFKLEHADFLKKIENIPDDDEHKGDRKWYTSIMLNRLMFVYFLQNKKMLNNRSAVTFDGEEEYLEEHLKESDKPYGFYRFLRHLFRGLNTPKPHPSELRNIIGEVQYVNGGIFEIHPLEDKYPHVTIPNDAFEQLLKFFKKFDWHLDTRPMRNDNEINPNVLGYIFEKYINNQSTMGAYYTKEDITEYISKNAIIPFLFTRVAEKSPEAFVADGPIWHLLRKNPDEYIYEEMAHGVLEPLPPDIEIGTRDVTQRTLWNKPADEKWALLTETWREVIERRRNYKNVHEKMERGEISSVHDLITYNLNIMQFALDVITACNEPTLLYHFYNAIEKITVLDPTCGSGAFLFAALNILQPLYQACLSSMGAIVEEHEKRQNELPESKRNPNAVIDDFKAILERVSQHRSREYFILKSIMVKNLYGVDYMEEAIEICKLRLFLKLVAQLERPQELEPLPDIDFNVLPGNTLVGFTNFGEVRKVTEKLINVEDTETTLKWIGERVDEIKRDEQSFRDKQTELGNTNDPAAKQQIRMKLNHISEKLNPYLATEYDVHKEKYGSAYEAEYQKWQKSHKPFHWWVEFYRIMTNGGFDVVIGNPPYVEYKNIRKEYEVKNLQTEPCGDLYAFVMERMQSINYKNSCLGMIVPISIVSTDGFKPLRDLLINKKSTTWLLNFAERPSKLFVGVEKRLTIWLSHYETPTTNLFLSKYRRWVAEERDSLFSNISFAENAREVNLVRTSIPKISSQIEGNILKKLSKNPPLGIFFQKKSSNVVFYTRKLRYFVQFFDFIPKITNSKGEVIEPSELKELYLMTETQKNVVIAALNSNLFFWFFNAYSDVRNVNRREIEAFRLALNSIDANIVQKLLHLEILLQEDFKRNARFLTNNYGKFGVLTIQSFQPRLSKPIINQIDQALAQHYGFTPEELDFIINYDVKYRLGRDNGEESEE